jgi:pyruvate/2-oxoglutarate/acetoin dehydrogenase E1 component
MREITYRDALNEAIAEEMVRDPNAATTRARTR